MSLEIERKWRVATPGDLPTQLPAGTEIKQGYVAIGPDEVRIRQKGAAKKLTFKQGSGLVRREFEVDLSEAQFATLWPATEGRRVEKVRHAVAYEGHTVEVDVFVGGLDGVIVAEVEFADRAAAEAFRPPAWFADELTGREEWSNARLALDGRPRGPR